MDYLAAKAYLEEAGKTLGIVPGLESIKSLLSRLGDPQDRLRFVSVAGTNGKGSVIAFLSSILQEAGYKTGCFRSPALGSFRESITVNEDRISRQDASLYIGKIRAAAADMRATGERLPTRFEMETALAFLHFAAQNCDPVLLETGLGGTHDATNVVQTTVLSVITSISMDHMAQLGNDLRTIAAHKAGIMRPKTPAVTVLQEPEALEMLRLQADKLQAPLAVIRPAHIQNIVYGLSRQQFSYQSSCGKLFPHLKIGLAGTYQIQNAALATETALLLHTLGYPCTETHIRNGLTKAKWFGRFTVISKRPLIVLDGAHNEGAAQQLRLSIDRYVPNRRKVFLLGIFRDKDYDAILRETASRADKIVTVEVPGNSRLLSAQELADALKPYHSHVEESINIADAVHKAMNGLSENDVLIVFGSLSFLKAAGEILQREVKHGS